MGCARFIYNAKCSEDRYFRTFSRKSLSLTGEKIPVDQSYSQFKSEETAWLKGCPSQILRNSTVIWYQSYQRFFQGLSGRPVPKRKGVRDRIWLTSELFRLEWKQGKWKLFIGSKTKNIGYLSFHAHRDFQLPKSITISRERGEYSVAFNYEDGRIPSVAWEQVQAVIEQGEGMLREATEAFDRGVAIPLQSSSGESFDLTPEQQAVIKKKQKGLKRHQRRLSRQQKGSQRYKRTRERIASDHLKMANIRNDFAHQTSRKLADSETTIFVGEDLRTKQMTKKPKPQQSKEGKYLPNGAAAKAGLNRSILESSWGKVMNYLGYKAKAEGKLVIMLSPHYSSQECVKCHHIHPSNRLSQSEFCCVGCGYTENADKNAADVMKERAVMALLEIPRENWEESGNGIWKIGKGATSCAQTPGGTRGSARGGKDKTQSAKLIVQSQGNANRAVA